MQQCHRILYISRDQKTSVVFRRVTKPRNWSRWKRLWRNQGRSMMYSGDRQSMTEIRRRVWRNAAWVEDKSLGDGAPRLERWDYKATARRAITAGDTRGGSTSCYAAGSPSFGRGPFPIIIRRCHASGVLCLSAFPSLNSPPRHRACAFQSVDDRARFGAWRSNQGNCLRETWQHRMQ